MKRAAALCIAFLLFFSTFASLGGVFASEEEDGWVTQDGVTYYVEDGYRTVGWRNIDGIPYYFNESGAKSSVWGIDVSEWNGYIDWEQVKEAGCTFVIIRLGYRSMSASAGLWLDEMFDYNMRNAHAAGVKIGVYFYSEAITASEAVAEAQFVINTLKNYPRIEYPICMDLEDLNYLTSSGRQAQARLSNTELYQISMAFCKTVEEAGYDAAMYSFSSFFSDRVSTSSYEENGYDVWYGDWMDYPDTITEEYTMWQYSESGTVPGISGAVDMDVSLYDYSGDQNLNATGTTSLLPGEVSRTRTADQYPTVTIGETGYYVYLVQRLLSSLGFRCAGGTDGIFGNATLTALNKYQRSIYMTATNYVGTSMWSILLNNGEFMIEENHHQGSAQEKSEEQEESEQDGEPGIGQLIVEYQKIGSGTEQPVAEYRVTASGLNLRSLPSLSGEVLTVLVNGDLVEAYTEQKNDGYTWLKVRCGSYTGWCVKEYTAFVKNISATEETNIEETDPEPEDSSAETPVALYEVEATYGLSLRADPYASAPKYEVMKEGTLIEVYGELVNDGYTWLKARYNGNIGYCVKDYTAYVKDIEPEEEEPEEEEPAEEDPTEEDPTEEEPKEDSTEEDPIEEPETEEPESKDPEPVAQYKVDATYGLSLRSDAYAGASRIVVMPDSALIEVYEELTNDGYTWLKARYNGNVGYCVKDYTAFVKELETSKEETTEEDPAEEEQIKEELKEDSTEEDPIEEPETEEPETEDPQPVAQYKVDATYGLSLRSDAYASASRIVVMPDSALIEVFEELTNDGYTWLKARYNGNVGYCVKGYTAFVKELETSKEKPAEEDPMEEETKEDSTEEDPIEEPETEEPETEDPQPVAQYKVNATYGLSLRSDAYAGASRIVVMPDSSEIEVYEELTNDGYTWLKVRYNGNIGYCVKNYTTFVKNLQSGEASEKETEEVTQQRLVTATYGLSLRVNAYANASRIVLMPYGSKVEVLDELKNDGYTWLKVRYNGNVGYCVKDYTVRQ